MDSAQVVVLAELLKEASASAALDPAVDAPTVVEQPDGSRAISLPRDQMDEPFRSMRLIDVAALGTTMALTFGWDDPPGDETVFVMPFDARDLELDVSDPVGVSAFLVRHVEFTLGGPREGWEPRTIPLSRRLSVVRPWTAG